MVIFAILDYFFALAVRTFHVFFQLYLFILLLTPLLTSAVDFPRDPKDAKFLECAIASNADYLVTGDLDFDEIPDLQNTRVVSASTFLEIVELKTENRRMKNEN